MAAFFLVALLVASASFFGMKVARTHRGEPWVATERFKNNMSLIGPQGVGPVTSTSASGNLPRARPRSDAASRVGGRSGPAPGLLSTESLQFVLALLVAASGFTFVCALLGMLAWEFSLGTLAGTGLFVAFLLESRHSRARPVASVARIRDWSAVHAPEEDLEVERSYAGSFG